MLRWMHAVLVYTSASVVRILTGRMNHAMRMLNTLRDPEIKPTDAGLCRWQPGTHETQSRHISRSSAPAQNTHAYHMHTPLGDKLLSALRSAVFIVDQFTHKILMHHACRIMQVTAAAAAPSGSGIMEGRAHASAQLRESVEKLSHILPHKVKHSLLAPVCVPLSPCYNEASSSTPHTCALVIKFAH